MQKKKVIIALKAGHTDFRKLISFLTSNQLINSQVLGTWTVKDILVHLSAWNREQAREIENILLDQPTWYKNYKISKDEDNFNRKVVEESKDRDIQSVIKDWENSFEVLIKRIEKLTQKEWNHKCRRKFGADSKPVTLQSLFSYEEKGLSDEGRHAIQVKDFFKL